MSQNTNIESTFRNAFDNFEAEVNAQVWTNIEQQLPASPAQPAVHAGADVVKTLVTGSKFSALSIGFASTIIIGVVALSYYLLKDNSVSTAIAPTTVTVLATEKHTENSIESSVSNTNNRTADTKPENALQKNVLVAGMDKPKPELAGNKTDLASKTVTNTVNDVEQESTPAQNQNTINESVNPAPAEIQNTKTTNPVKSDVKSSADEKHENISSPALSDPNQQTINTAKTAVTVDNFEWGKVTNVITPNGDGNNDKFKLSTQNVSTLFVVIQDRTGKNIFQWNGIEGYWEGKDLKGNNLPAGVYYYYIFATSIDELTHRKQGSITLLR